LTHAAIIPYMNQSLSGDAGELDRRTRELSILNQIAQALNREVDLQRALQTTLAHVARLLDLSTGWIWLLAEHTGEPYLAAAQNLPPGLAREPRRMQGSCYCLDTFRAGDLNGAANVNVVTCSRLRSLVDGTNGLRYHASIPLYAQGKKLGVLNVASPDWRELSDADLRLLLTIGDLTGIAVQRARLFDEQARLGAVEERNRLAREIHDTLAQGLTAITLQLETADALLEAQSEAPAARQAVLRALALTRANLEEARRSVQDLRAAPLEGLTLQQALERLTHETAVQGKLAVTFSAYGEQPLPLRVESALYRMAQEALRNVVRHSQARHASVRLDLGPEQARLVVEDDGRGFDPESIPPGHYGLTGLQERARLAGGSIRLASSPGSGTRLEARLPLRGA
jgi:two-component system NarL family sensor kinase